MTEQISSRMSVDSHHSLRGLLIVAWVSGTFGSVSGLMCYGIKARRCEFSD